LTFAPWLRDIRIVLTTDRIGKDARAAYALVVAEDEQARQETGERLRRIGVRSVATCVDELLELPDISPPRLVVLDAHSAGEECHRTQMRLRRHPRLRDLALLVLGEESDLRTLALAVGHGASAYLSKHVGDEVLASFVAKLQRPSVEQPGVEQRNHPRRPLLVPVEVEVWGARKRATAWLMDASASGCCIETAAAVNEGDAVKLWLPLAEATARQPLTGQARWVQGASAGLVVTGIRFAAAAAFIAGLALGIDVG
jgi:CheY-like chemotaxis protein